MVYCLVTAERGRSSVGTFAENLRKFRKRKKLTQEDLANLVGTSKQVISRYEIGARTPKITVVGKISDVLGVDIHDLLGTTLVEEPETELGLKLEKLKDLFETLTPENQERILDLMIVLQQGQAPSSGSRR